MRKSRVSEMPQRQSLRIPLQKRTSNSESDRSHPTMTNRRPTADRNPKLGSRCSPRNPPFEQRTSSSESDGSHPTMTNRHPPADRNPKLGDRCSPQYPLVEKKLRTRISDLESQLGQVQEELKKFKVQLALADVDKKREAEEEVEKPNKQIPAESPLQIQDSQHKIGSENPCFTKSPEENAISEGNLETDVFEVPLASVAAEPKIDPTYVLNQKDSETKPTEGCSELVAEPKKLVEPLNLLENTEISELKVKLAEKEKEIKSICAENDGLKQQVSEAAARVSVAQAKEEETALELCGMRVELEQNKARAVQVMDELKVAVEAKDALEAEMKKLRVQTEQWKKAACTAASVLAGEVEMGGQRVAAKRSSLGKRVDGFELAGYGGFDSLEDFDEGLESGKRKGAGIRMFGDLWKRKGEK